MERRPNGAQRATATNQLELARAAPFRARWRQDPIDDADGFPTVELHGVSIASAVRAFRTGLTLASSVLLLDALRCLSGRNERLSPALAAYFAQHGLSRSLRVDAPLIAELARCRDRRLTLAAIDGPVDAADAAALEASLSSGRPPLDAELRAATLVQCGHGRAAWGQFRSAPQARRFVGDTFASAVARMIDADAPLPRPQDSVLLGLVGVFVNGCVVRPRDLRVEDGTVVVPLRSSRSGRVAASCAFDRVTMRWYV
ncbi:MAG: hypothetical protein U0572_05280 [Phycisphaerales bacterium]